MRILSAILLIFLQFFSFTSFSQQDISRTVLTFKRGKPYANATGHYALVASIDKIQVDRGDSAAITLFITGYGMIKSAKLFISFASNDIIDNLYAEHSFGLVSNKLLGWGIQKTYFKDSPLSIDIGGFLPPFDSTFFVDYDTLSRSNAIITEYVLNKAPVVLRFKIKKDAPPNSYNAKIYFTYFNGVDWDGASETLELKVNSYYESNESWLEPLAIVLAIISILPLLWDGIKGIKNVVQLIYKKTQIFLKQKSKKSLRPNSKAVK